MNFIKDHFPNEFQKVNNFIPKSHRLLNNLDETVEFLEKYYKSSIAIEFVYPCIFLNEKTGECDIYSARPVICRLHGIGHPFTVCSKILHTLDFKKRQVGLREYKNLIELYSMGIYSNGEKQIYCRPYSIADWFSSVLSMQYFTKNSELEDCYRKPFIEFFNNRLKNALK
jgi:Fe-S-cluster containining protein